MLESIGLEPGEFPRVQRPRARNNGLGWRPAQRPVDRALVGISSTDM